MSIQSPLADQMRPKTLNDVVGQQHLLGPHQPLNTLIKNHRPTSFIFYGPPGTGKTTLANVIANEWQVPFEKFNAAIDTKATLQKLIKAHPDASFVLLLDEIHRLTKPIQDFLLPYLESGHILLIGATTENPMISIAPAIRSRASLFELKAVNSQDITKNLARIHKITHAEINLDHAVFTTIANYSNGDVRTSINLYDTLINMYGTKLDANHVKQYAKNQNFIFDKNGDQHYDTISALQKSIRGWDTDAALYYTAIMCESGDLKTLIRRLMVIAYEDIGLADPTAAQQAATALLVSEQLGLPEARLSIANAVILLCNATHSNSAHDAINLAMEDAKNHQNYNIPNHLKDAHYKGANALGHGNTYKYPHDYKHDFVVQQYLPTPLLNHQYYQPKDNPNETKMSKRYYGFKKLQNQKFKSN